ncbi:BTB/POZ domain-containing protein 6-B-like [Paramacrobiotus metropolitanus]|uniref:BTB/POZ domain-containing protein 6-B-like n=1 Tax=Paramacrobiotus metropolitanus TaxID=2943436 RepID=UPI002445B369|nr:BTB/POZ domain-containing protein 6-B-like [Paramacrobiotus metropolitanus]XP_055347364.1 BTB/POZ domain-containing protein 6-B-like [Paramacrobiotus metropolitanus]XP_055347371.1 BTB/POZ domain-containing protein 6-B-like [Paramacrobiotus metropolitanus]
MFYGSLPEKRQVIDIPDVLPDAFANMLSFLYTDTVDLRVDVVIQTLLCADKYEVPLLVDKCCEFVSTQLNTENCLIFLKNGVERRAEKIAESCLQFIDRSADDVIALGDFAAVGKEMLEMILLRNTLSAEEHNIYLAVERWARNACESNNLDPSAANRRAMLGDALFLVRFPLLTDTQLVDGPLKSGLLLASEGYELYKYKHTQSEVKPQLPFPTEPRTGPIHPDFGPVHRIGDIKFQHEEKVFIKSSSRPVIWTPAMIIGIRQGEILWRCLTQPAAEESGDSERIVRAAVVLKPGRKLQVEIEGEFYDATYRRANGEQYVVQRYPHLREMSVDFARLTLKYVVQGKRRSAVVKS